MSSETTTGRKPKTIALGANQIEITDPGQIQPVAADLMTEIRLHGTTVSVSFASYIVDGSGPPEARVCARLRLSLETISNFQQVLQQLLDEAGKARQSAN